MVTGCLGGVTLPALVGVAMLLAQVTDSAAALRQPNQSVWLVCKSPSDTERMFDSRYDEKRQALSYASSADVASGTTPLAHQGAAGPSSWGGGSVRT